MKIRYQNGQTAEAITLYRGESIMRVAVRGTEDVLELRRAAGTWVTEDCEPVTIEYSSRRTSDFVTEEDCTCAADLAARLIHLLFTDSSEDVREAPEASEERKACASAHFA